MEPVNPKRVFPTAAEITVGAALGCNIAWVSMSFKSMSLFASYHHGESLLDTTYLISIIAVTLTLALAGIADRATGRFLKSKLSLYLLPFGVCASTLLMPLAGFEGIAGTAFVSLAGVLSGVFSGLFLIRFGMSFSLLPMRAIVTGAASAHILSTLLFALFLLFSPFEACVFAASMPLIAAVLLEFGMKNIGLAPQEAPCPLDQQTPIEDPLERRDWAHLVTRLGLCALLVGFANEAVRTLYIQMGIASVGGTVYAFTQALVAFGVTAGAIAIALILLNSRSERMAKNCYHAIVVFLVIGALLLPLPLVYPDSSAYLPYAANAAAYQCFSLFMWVIVTGVCNRYASVRIRTFSFARAAWAVGPLLGMLLGRFVLHQHGIQLASAFPIMLVSALVILLVSSAVFTESDLLKAMDIIPLERKRRFQEKCLKVVDRYGPTERETEILIMFAKGRNLPCVQDQLCLSKSTVSTHRQHIYQKLGIHSQQELINLVQEID